MPVINVCFWYRQRGSREARVAFDGHGARSVWLDFSSFAFMRRVAMQPPVRASAFWS